MKPEIKFERITPKKAGEYLATMGRNRNLRRNVVKAYARDITSGSYRVTHQGIAFDVSGRLVDGQHRLQAIVESGLAIEMPVTRGLDELSVEAIDTGIKRGTHDVLKIAGIELASPRFVAIAKKFLTGRAGVMHQSSQTVHELRDLITLHRDALTFAYEHYSNRQRSLGSASIPASIARAAYYVPHVKLVRFAEVLQSGMPDDRGERIVLTLRNWLLENQNAKPGADAIYAKTEKAIELFAKGENVNQIYQAKEELYLLPKNPEVAFGRMAAL